MSRRGLFGALLLLALGTPAWGQEPANLESPQIGADDAAAAPRGGREPMWSSPQTQDEPSMSSNLWLYLHEERRHDDPKQAVRRKAEAKAAARSQRIAAMQWYGQSNQRPNASSVPFMGTYSPTWAGTAAQPSNWAGIYRRPFLTPVNAAPVEPR